MEPTAPESHTGCWFKSVSAACPPSNFCARARTIRARHRRHFSSPIARASLCARPYLKPPLQSVLELAPYELDTVATILESTTPIFVLELAPFELDTATACLHKLKSPLRSSVLELAPFELNTVTTCPHRARVQKSCARRYLCI